MRKHFQVGIGCNSNVEKVSGYVMQVLLDILEILAEGKPPKTSVGELGDSAVILTVRYWINTFDQQFSSTDIHTMVITKVLTTLQDHKVELPENVVEVKKV